MWCTLMESIINLRDSTVILIPWTDHNIQTTIFEDHTVDNCILIALVIYRDLIFNNNINNDNDGDNNNVGVVKKYHHGEEMCHIFIFTRF